MQTIVDIWDKKYIKERDKIAHGGNYNNSFEIEDVVYNIMTIILQLYCMFICVIISGRICCSDILVRNIQ